MSESGKVEHPLANLYPTAFQSFDEWLARWNSTTVLWEKLGLLHCLQTMEYWLKGREQTVFFLLNVADGHRTTNPFYRHSDYISESGIEGCKAISRKAFDVLCAKLFNPGKENYPPLWWWMLEEQETFDKLLWFCNSDNYSPPYDEKKVSHQTEIFGGFLREFSRLGWTYNPTQRSFDRAVDVENIRVRMIAARPRFIEILHWIRQLRWLNKPNSAFSSDFPELDQACLAKLREIAFREDLPLPARDINASSMVCSRPKTLREAICGGSIAAEIIVLHSIRRREQKRLAGLFEASRRRWQEAQRRDELRQVAQQQETLAKRAAELEH